MENEKLIVNENEEEKIKKPRLTAYFGKSKNPSNETFEDITVDIIQEYISKTNC